MTDQVRAFGHRVEMVLDIVREFVEWCEIHEAGDTAMRARRMAFDVAKELKRGG